MKRLLVFLFLFSCFFVFSKPTFAHLVGQAPFFKVDGVYSGFYNVPSTSLDDFNLPQDAGPKNYLVGENISFILDTAKLPVPQDIVKKTTFDWDFGDGSKGTGLTNDHVYKKMGTYLLQINATYTDNGQTVPPQLLETISLNIIPNKEYKLPQSVVYVNGQTNPQPATSSIYFKPGINTTLDGTHSKAGTAKIVSYFWDLGDSTTSNQVKLTHVYPNNFQLAFPMLRVKDSNGFISDNYVQLAINAKPPSQNTTAQAKTEESKPKTNTTGIYTIIGGAIFIVLALIIFVILAGRKKK